MRDKDSNKNLIFINTLCSCIEFSGENSVDFLNNLLISDLKTFNTHKFYYTALCNPKGRIIASLWINIKNKNNIQLICPKNMQEELLTFFTMRKFRLKIDIIVTKTPMAIDQEGVLITGDLNDCHKETNLNHFYAVLFKQNLPWVDKANTEKFIPQHVNLDQHEHIMSFKKGCYPGQEIIARMKFLGKINKRMGVITNDSRENLIENINSQNQVSPIVINTKGNFSVQVIEKIIGINE